MTELDQLRAQLAEAQAEIERLKREVSHWKNNHETEVRRARVLKERIDMPIERAQAYEKWGDDQLQLAASQATNEKLREAVGLWIGIASNCAIESGCCHCGDSMDNHASPFVCGHSPVDMADTAVSHAIEKSDEALALPNDNAALNAALAAVYEECAKVSDEHNDFYGNGKAIGEKIRALAKQRT